MFILASGASRAECHDDREILSQHGLVPLGAEHQRRVYYLVKLHFTSPRPNNVCTTAYACAVPYDGIPSNTVGSAERLVLSISKR